MFGDLEGVVASEAVLATNTSSLSVAGIAATTEHPGRVVGMHFFNPVPAMRLVEVVTGPSTDPSTVSQVEEVAERLGKTRSGSRHAWIRREPRRQAFLPRGPEAGGGRW